MRTSALASCCAPRYDPNTMLRRCDRYMLREMIGPFVLALAGLVLFILLNIILSLSDLMVDRGISMATLLRLVLLKVPSLLVVAVPMAAMFATFLGLGRMTHDQEIIAFEALGISLRRLLLPLIIAASIVGIADFAIYNWLVPASESAYQQAFRGVVFRQGVPRITANAFFKGPNDQYFYIRRYDESTGKLYDVYVYDTSGRLFPQAQTQITMITAQEGTWTGGAWELGSANVYGFDRETQLVYTATIDSLILPIDQAVEQILSQSRTPTEMGITELRQRIAQARVNGQRTDEYVVEAHLKLSLPIATVIFVLLGGSLSLAFLPRSRAAGVVLGLLLVAVFQGVLWWTQTLGRRGAMNPALAAWLPDLLFGVVGVLLFMGVDRLASRDVWSRMRTRIPFLILILLAASGPVGAQGLPVHLECENLFVSEDRTMIRADGAVAVTFSDTDLTSDRLTLERTQTSSWRISASGSVVIRTEDDLELSASDMTAILDTSSGSVVLQRAEASNLSGRSRFSNSAGESQDLFFRAERGEITYDDQGDVDVLEARETEMTTCDCCSVGISGRPYSLNAGRFLLYPDRLLVAFDLAARAGGAAILWLPIYVQPLKETLEAPLFPAIGRDALRGWFVKWSVPFLLSESVYGTVLADVYSRFIEVGFGGVLRYDLGGQAGRISAYVFPAKVGDSRLDLDLRHQISLASDWIGTGRLQYEALGPRDDLTFSFRLGGPFDGGEISIVAVRSARTEEDTRIEERLPELDLTFDDLSLGRLRWRPSVTAGWYREWEVGADAEERARFRGSLEIAADAFSLAGFRIKPSGALQASLYTGVQGWTQQQQASFSVTAAAGGVELAWNSVFVHGSSPFEFDRASSAHRLQWSLSKDGPVAVTIDGDFEVGQGLGPVTIDIDWGRTTAWSVNTTIDPIAGRLTAYTVQGRWTTPEQELLFKVPYDAIDGRFRTATLDVFSSSPGLRLTLATDFDLNVPALLSADISAELALPADWGATLGATYTPSSGFRSPVFGLFKDIADCVRVGIERSLGQVWLYASILAFPEAVLRYAPRASRLEIGD